MKGNGVNEGQFEADDLVQAKKAASRPQKGIPPHIAWPLFVIGLLVLGVGWSLSVVFASRSDGGAQVVENYYEKAIEWDARSELLRKSAEAGWTVNLEYVSPGPTSEAGVVEIVFKDKEGEPISNLEGKVRAFRPQKTQPIAELTVSGSMVQPGIYRQAFPNAASGLWDFEIDVVQDSFRFLKTIRTELNL